MAMRAVEAAEMEVAAWEWEGVVEAAGVEHCLISWRGESEVDLGRTRSCTSGSDFVAIWSPVCGFQLGRGSMNDTPSTMDRKPTSEKKRKRDIVV